MAKYTKDIAILSASTWQEISTGEDTVLLQVHYALPGRIVLAVVDLLADADSIVGQHLLTEHDNPVANFYNLSGKIIVARKLVATESPSLIATAY